MRRVDSLLLVEGSANQILDTKIILHWIYNTIANIELT